MDSVLDAFNSIVESVPGAILNSNSNLPENKKTDYKTKVSDVASRPLWGDTEESENTWGSSWGKGSTTSNGYSAWDSNRWDNNNNNNNIVSSRGNNNNDNSSWGNNNNDTNSSWGNNNNDGNSAWGNENNYERNYSTTEYTDDRGYQNYQNVNKVTDTIRPGINLYTDNGTNDVSGPNNVDLYTNNVNNNFVDLYTNNEYDNNQTSGWSQQQQQQQQQQQHSYYESKGESPSPSESETLTENSEPVDIKSKLSAWHSLADPNARERDDGIGGGQLHRRGKNFIPLAEEKVLAIQQKGGGSKRGGKKIFAPPIRNKNTIQNQIGKPPIKPSQKSVAPLKPDTSQKPPAQKVSNKIAPAPVKTPVPPQNQKQNIQPTPPPSRTQQTQLPTPPPSQSSQSLQRQGPSRDAPLVPLSSRIQPPQQPPQQPQPQSQQPQQPQQRPQQSQQSQQPKQSWTPQQLVNEPFWETNPSPSSPPPQNKQSKQYANEMITSQSQPIRHQSSQPTKPVQDYSLPFIPPEFDSAPYRKQLSPSPMSNGYNNNEWDDKNYDSNVEYPRNEYYDEEESDFEKQDDKTNHIYQVDQYDRGEILLTINVELEEGKDGKEGKTQAIEVHVNDRPTDLAKDFCNKWRVNNPVVMPALESLIREEKEKRLGIN